MESQGSNIAFLSGGNLSKASHNKLKNYRNSLANNYDVKRKNEIKEFIIDLKNGKLDLDKLNSLIYILNLIKNKIDTIDYSNQPYYKTFQKINILKCFVQHNMSASQNKKFYIAISENYDLINITD